MAPAEKDEQDRIWPELVATGCADPTITNIVKGVYRASGMNHSRPVYKKREKAKGLDVLIYFWDDRDGLELCGWWFGPAVGGDQVWAFHPSRVSVTPPSSDWNIPNDGAIDGSFTISARMPASGSSSKSKAVEAAPVDDAVRRKLEAIQKEQQEFEARMKEIQRRAEERRRREEELRKRLAEAEGEGEAPPAKRPRAPDEAAAAAATRLEEERRRLEEEARRKAEDEARQEEEEKRRRAERRKREEEEERKRREAEQARRKEEEERWRREEAKQQQERQRRLNEEAKRRKEEVAVLAVLDAMCRMACAVPEDFAALKSMLEAVLETLLPLTGKQRGTLKAEADRVLKRAEAFADQAAMLRNDWEEWYELTQKMPPALRDG